MSSNLVGGAPLTGGHGAALLGKPGYADDPAQDNRDLEGVVRDHVYKLEGELEAKTQLWGEIVEDGEV